MQEGAADVPPGEAGGGRHITRGLGSLTAYSGANAFLRFVLIFVLVRFLSPADYGTYSAVYVSVIVASMVGAFGLGSAVVRFLAPSPEDPKGEGWGSAKAGFYLAVAASAGVAAAFAALAPYLSAYFLKTPSDAWVFYLGAAWLFATNLDLPVRSMLQGLRRYALYSEILTLSRVGTVAVAVVGAVAYHSLAIVLLSLVLYESVNILAALPAVWGPLRRADPRPYYGRVLRYALPLGAAAAVTIVAGNADVFVVGGYFPPSSLAVYYATVQVSSLLYAFLVLPLITALFAEVSYRSESEERVRLGARLALRFSMLALLPASLFTAAVAPQLLVLFSGGGACCASRGGRETATRPTGSGR